jgi:hypothetical protein
MGSVVKDAITTAAEIGMDILWSYHVFAIVITRTGTGKNTKLADVPTTEQTLARAGEVTTWLDNVASVSIKEISIDGFPTSHQTSQSMTIIPITANMIRGESGANIRSGIEHHFANRNRPHNIKEYLYRYIEAWRRGQ